DSNGNVFVADTGNGAIEEIPAAGSYASVATLIKGAPFKAPVSVSVDSSGNLFVADQTAGVFEMPIANSYTKAVPLGGSFNWNQPVGVTVEPSGDLLVVS